jgi:hypothetical protein
MWCLLLCLAVQDSGASPQGPRPPSIALPEGPAARAFAQVAPDTQPAEMNLSFLPVERSDPAWEREEVWQDWAVCVRETAKSKESDPVRRARLCLYACVQGRSDDAWEHFSALTAEPQLSAALLPLLAPGVPVSLAPEVRASKGGRSGAMPDGALLRPMLPPPPTPVAELELGRTWIEPRKLTIEGLRVGAATLAMGISLEADGIQIDLDHRGGGPAKLSILLPEPADFAIYVAYLDWYPQARALAPIEVQLEPGSETRTLFGRFRPRRLDWPTRIPRAMPVGLIEAGLRVEVGPGDPELRRCASFTSALGTLFGVPARLVETDSSAAPEEFPGLRMALFAGPSREQKLMGLVSLAERFALAVGVR